MYRLQKNCRPEVPTLGVLSKNRLLSVFPPSFIPTVILLCFHSCVQQASEQEMVKLLTCQTSFRHFCWLYAKNSVVQG